MLASVADRFRMPGIAIPAALLGAIWASGIAADGLSAAPQSLSAPVASMVKQNTAVARSGALSRPARLNIRDLPLPIALEALHEASDVPLVFSPSMLPEVVVSCPCADASVGDALAQLLRQTGFEVVSSGEQVVLVPQMEQLPPSLTPTVGRHQELLLASPVPRPTISDLGRNLKALRVAQTVATVSGQVTDARTGQPVPAVQVFISALDIGVLTQQNGRYLLLNVPSGTHAVTAQRIGYAAATAVVSATDGAVAVQNFALSEEALQLDEVIVTGTPGGTQRRAIGNTVATVDVSDVVQNAPVANFQDLLSGRGVGGVRFSRLAGNVGTGSPMTLRGPGSFSLGRSQPLIFVDGVRVNNNANAGTNLLSMGSAVNVLNDFNPSDIERIEIIKGPAAASLYGTEASAGVIQIITKKGEVGAPEFSISVREGVNFMTDPAGRLGSLYYCPTAASYGCTSRDQLVEYNMYEEGTRYIREGYFPWQSENLYSSGFSRAYEGEVRGGTESMRYYASAGYTGEQGYTYFNKDEKFQGRANLSVNLGEYFALDISTGITEGFTRFGDSVRQEGGIWQDLIWSKGYYLDTNLPFDQPGANPRLGGFQERLPTDHDLVELTRDYTRFTGSTTLNFRSGSASLGGLTASLASRAVVGLDKGWDTNQALFPIHQGVVPEHLRQYTSQWLPVFSQTTTGYLQYDRPITTAVTLDYSLTASLDLNNTWSSNTSFGAQYYENQVDRVQSEGRDFASPVSTTINQVSPATVSMLYENVTDKSLGFYIQEELGWNERVFVTGALRFDDNSTFGAEAPARTYPKVSATWVVSEESFWTFDFMNSLRVRGAWGQAGRQPTAIAGFNTYSAIPGPRGTSAIQPENPGNPGVEPEVSTELELGFDAAFLNDRLSGAFTHYWRKDENLLSNVAVPGSFGIPGSISRNLGRLDNWGWEAQLRARVYESPAVSFDLDLSADYTNNEIKELDDASIASQTGGIQIGLPFPSHIVRAQVVSAEWDPAGAFTNVYGQRISAMCDMGVFLGPYDRNDPNLTREQRLENSKYGTLPGGPAAPCGGLQYLWAGRAFAPWSFSVAPTINLFNNSLSIFALAEGQYGRLAREDGKAWSHYDATTPISLTQDDPLWVAALRLNSTNASFETTYFDADFWKLREVGARYNLPRSLIERTPASRASLAVSARNLWTIWRAQTDIYGAQITDPEFGSPANLGGVGGWWEMPPLANVNVTLRVTF
jgi:TonB-linked SusC/RagA family outer membrane protein